jgi:hypothetical protein
MTKLARQSQVTKTWSRMKKVKPIDLLPSLFGVLLIISWVYGKDLVTRTDPHPSNPAEIFWLLTLLTAIGSILTAVGRRRFKLIHYLNVVWIIVSLGFVYLLLQELSHGIGVGGI